MSEEWRAVPGFEGRYEVSSLGRVRSLLHGTPRIKKSFPSPNGYLTVGLHANRKRHSQNVHRLVAIAFHGAPEGKLDARHLDGNKLNNSADNIAWGTRSENMQDAIRHGTHSLYLYLDRCKNGHTRTSENTRVESRPGRRACDVCRIELQRSKRHPLAPATHCKHGHEFTPENTYASRGTRHCRACRARRSAEWRDRRTVPSNELITPEQIARHRHAAPKGK